MPNIVISYGWQKKFPATLLKDHGATLFYVADSQSPFHIMQDTPLGPMIDASGTPLLKNIQPALPYLRLQQDAAGNTRPYYLMEEDAMLGLSEIDLFIPYVVPSSYDAQRPFLEFLHYHNVPMAETLSAFTNCLSKIKTHEILTAANVPMPPSLALSCLAESAKKQAQDFFNAHNGQIIVKKDMSRIGEDIFLPKDPTALKDALDLIFKQGQDALIQQKIEIAAPLHHIRVAMSYGEIIAAQKFIANPQSPTSHVGQHTGVEEITLEQDQINICQNAAKALEVNTCSLDCLLATDGNFYILEANIMPSINEWFPEQAEQMVKKIIEKNLS